MRQNQLKQSMLKIKEEIGELKNKLNNSNLNPEQQVVLLQEGMAE